MPNPKPELVHSELPDGVQQRLTRMMHDARALRDSLTRAQARSARGYLEETRDLLSRLLDRAEGKHG
jgi:hypothetical protein